MRNSYIISIWAICLLGLALIPLTGSSQQYFSKRYKLNGYEDWSFSTNIIQDSTIYILQQEGPSPLPDGNRRISFLKLDLSGNSLGTMSLFQDSASGFFSGWGGGFLKWKNAPGFVTIGTKYSWVPEGRYDRGILMRFNNTMDTLWSNEISDFPPHDSSYLFRNFRQLDDKGFICVGTYTNVAGTSLWRIVMARTDSNGNKRFLKLYGTSNKNYYSGFGVIRTSDKGFAVSGFIDTISACFQCSDPLLIKTDSSGNKQWMKRFGNPYCSEVQALIDVANDGNIQVGTHYSDSCSSPSNQGFFARINSLKIRNDSSTVWNKKYGIPQLSLQIFQLKVLGNGDIIIIGNYEHSDLPGIWPSFILRTDSSGNEKWYREYELMIGDLATNQLYSIIPTNDKGFACSGFVVPGLPPDTGIQDCWVLKVDSAGCENPGQCWVGTHEIIVKTFDPDNPFVIYPNPAHEEITVEFHQNDNGAEIELEDQVGKTISRGHLAAMKSDYVLDLTSFTAGIYFLKVTIERKIITRKIIKL